MDAPAHACATAVLPGMMLFVIIVNDIKIKLKKHKVNSVRTEFCGVSLWNAPN